MPTLTSLCLESMGLNAWRKEAMSTELLSDFKGMGGIMRSNI